MGEVAKAHQMVLVTPHFTSLLSLALEKVGDKIVTPALSPVCLHLLKKYQSM